MEVFLPIPPEYKGTWTTKRFIGPWKLVYLEPFSKVSWFYSYKPLNCGVLFSIKAITASFWSWVPRQTFCP